MKHKTMEHKIIWHYEDGDQEFVAQTEWASGDLWPIENLKHAGREGCELWKEEEPLEDALGLTGRSWMPSLTVEYLEGSAIPGGASRNIVWCLASRPKL